MHTNQRRSKKQGTVASIAMVAMFLAFLIIVSVGLHRLSSAASTEGAEAMYQAIERAAVLCYASEGFYPPTLAYIEENYGVQIDRTNYVIHYQVFASNIMPQIQVTSRG